MCWVNDEGLGLCYYCCCCCLMCICLSTCTQRYCCFFSSFFHASHMFRLLTCLLACVYIYILLPNALNMYICMNKCLCVLVHASHFWRECCCSCAMFRGQFDMLLKPVWLSLSLCVFFIYFCSTLLSSHWACVCVSVFVFVERLLLRWNENWLLLSWQYISCQQHVCCM